MFCHFPPPVFINVKKEGGKILPKISKTNSILFSEMKAILLQRINLRALTDIVVSVERPTSNTLHFQGS